MEHILAPSEPHASPIFSALPGVFLPDVDTSLVWPQAAGRSTGVCGEAAGLVYSETSHNKKPQTHLHRLIQVDSKAARLKKMRSSIITAARLHEESKPKGFRKERVAFLTLTYRPGETWKPKQISALITHMRAWFARREHKLRFVWVMELHKDGRPHYHALVWLPKGLTLPKPDKQGWWPHGMTKIELARNPVGYIAKYASKGERSGFVFPEGSRIHGSGGLLGDALLESRWWKLPAWCRELSQPSDCLRRCIGGGILNSHTGEILLTPWRVEFYGGSVYIYRIDRGDDSFFPPA